MFLASRFELSKKAVWGAAVRVAVVVAAAGAVSCSGAVYEGTGSSFLIVDALSSTSGNATVQSDVVSGGGIAPDVATVTLSLGLKDPLAPSSPTQSITIDRYRVVYTRADGRNTPGVDVPHPFDSAMTLTVSGSSTATFTLVRQVAKAEAPLGSLATSPVIISTVAEVTFFGRDQAGREASVSGRLGVDFGNFADADQ
jgi:hypothetical protein